MQVQPRLVPPGHTTLSQTLQEGRTPERFNFWGYSTAAFFAPMARYSSAVAQGAPGQAAGHELKLLVRECHARGLEVIMDVVFNHTAEGNQQGPSISLRLPPGTHLLAGCAVRAPGLRASCGAARLPRPSLSGCACLQTRPSLLHTRCLEGWQTFACRDMQLPAPAQLTGRLVTGGWTTACFTCWPPGESTTTTAAAATPSTATTPLCGASCWTACATGCLSTMWTASGVVHRMLYATCLRNPMWMTCQEHACFPALLGTCWVQLRVVSSVLQLPMQRHTQ